MHRNSLAWLQAWYTLQCQEIGTEASGILIQSSEKPEWIIKINLQMTPLYAKQFTDLTIQRTAHDWLICRVTDDCFQGHCALQNLLEVIDIFREWALSKAPRMWSQKFTVEKTPNFKMLSLFMFREETKM